MSMHITQDAVAKYSPRARLAILVGLTIGSWTAIGAIGIAVHAAL